MDWARAKTLLICMLLAVNAVLGGIWFFRAHEDGEAARQAERELRRLLYEKGIDTGGAPLPSETALRYDIERDPDMEKAMAEVLIGPVVRRDGSAASYQGEGGQADFRLSGRFEITLTQPIAVTGQSLTELARAMGMLPPSEEWPSYGYTLEQTAEGLPVWNCTALFSLSKGGLVSVSGQWLAGEVLPVSAEPCFSAGYCLLELAQRLPPAERRTLISCTLGFFSEPASPTVERLTPHWRVELSDGIYYVNAVTGRAV